MKLLLDTHILIWSMEEPERLGSKARAMLEDMRNERFVSSVSAFEIAQAIFVGKLSLARPLVDWFQEARRHLHAWDVPLNDAIAMEAYTLPEGFHKDPADRL